MRAPALIPAFMALAACADLGIEPPPMPSVEAASRQAAGEAELAAAEPEAAGETDATGPDAAEGWREADETLDSGKAGAAAAAEAAPEADALPEPAAAAPDSGEAAGAPHVYMALQPERGRPVSVVFTIDSSRDNTPSDEPAIRITPEETGAGAGRCNPQQLRYYEFPGESAARPVYGPDEAARGVGVRELPDFMATAVSSEMMERGIAAELEDTRPQNVCTRKLFQQTIIAASTGKG